MELSYIFASAYILDLAVGDPAGWPHPVRFMGRIIQFLQRLFYRRSVLAGGLFWAACTASVLAILAGLYWVLDPAPLFLEALVWVYLIYACLATKSLYAESRRVEAALRLNDLNAARSHLSYIVSRDTGHLEKGAVRRGAVETVAENLADGVAGPMVYLLALGLPGIIFYKMVNTLDSMVGYKNDRFLLFGRVSARVDDAVNYVPARITAALIVAAAFLLRLNGRRAWRTLKRDHGQSASPNAGWPEAAMAGALGVRLGGPSVYFGRTVPKPYIGDGETELTAGDFRGAVRLLYAVSLICALIAFLLMIAARPGWFGLAGLLF